MSESGKQQNGLRHGLRQSGNALNQDDAIFRAKWERLYRLFDLDPWDTKNDLQFAQLIGKTRQAVQHGRTNKKIPMKWLSEMATKFGVAIDYILTGNGAPYLNQPPDQGVSQAPAGQSASEPSRAAAVQDWAPYSAGQFKMSEALTMATRVLESDTSYALALYLNIQHFDRAIQAETRISHLERSLSEFKRLIDAQQQQIAELKQQITEIRNTEAKPISEPPEEQVA